MAEVVVLAENRENVGKGAARRYRAAGKILGEFYASQEENIHLLINKKEFESILARTHGLVTLNLKDQKRKLECVVKDYQVDPVKGGIIHVDFQGIKRGEKLTVKVPIVLIGTSEGVKTGGILEHLIREAEIQCLPKDIPQKFEIDITSLEIGDSVRIKDLKYENIEFQDDPEETILLIDHPRVIEEEVVEEVEEEEGAEEPEVITAKKEDEE